MQLLTLINSCTFNISVKLKLFHLQLLYCDVFPNKTEYLSDVQLQQGFTASVLILCINRLWKHLQSNNTRVYHQAEDQRELKRHEEGPQMMRSWRSEQHSTEKWTAGLKSEIWWRDNIKEIRCVGNRRISTMMTYACRSKRVVYSHTKKKQKHSILTFLLTFSVFLSQIKLKNMSLRWKCLISPS